MNIKHKKGELSFLCHRSVQLAQCTRRAVAWVSKGLFPQQFLAFIDSIKGRICHIDFAAQFQIFNGVLEFNCNIINDFCVGRHIFPEIPAIPAGNGSDKLAIFIAQCHRKTVDLRLHQEGDLLPQLLPTIVDKVVYLFLSKEILHRQHGYPMGH